MFGHGQDYMTIGSSPIEERCAQVGQDNYDQCAKVECRIFIEQLKRQFGLPPGTARLAVKGFPHDFGTYYEVVVWYLPDNEEEANYAFKLEGETPGIWDDTSQKAIEKSGILQWFK
jgi:hypothetical protein